MRRTWKPGDVIRGWLGNPIKIVKSDDPFDPEDKAVGERDLTVFDAMLVVVNMTRCETLEDSSKSKALKQALRASRESGKIELEGEIFKWLKSASEKSCPLAWQDNANEVHDVITEGFRKENEPPKVANRPEAT